MDIFLLKKLFFVSRIRIIGEYEHSIIEKTPFSHPFSNGVKMLTRICIPYDNMTRIFKKSDITKQYKCMLS
jgi:hypothetical protein